MNHPFGTEVGQRNDGTLVLAIVLLGAVGGLYGVETSTTPFEESLFGAIYSFVGACAGVALAAAVNAISNWR
jgi:hypothetical protein